MPAENTLTELEFRVTDETYPFVDGSETASCRCELRELLPRSDGGYLEFFEVRGGPPQALERAVDRTDAAEARVVDDRSDAGIVVVDVEHTEDCVATTLADQDVFLRELRADDGEGRIVVEVTPSKDPATVVAAVTEAHPSVDLVAKRERPPEGALFVRERVGGIVEQRLTDRQREVLVAAYHNGYFQRPRETTGADLAEQLDITPATLSQHLRAAQRKVFSVLLEDGVIDTDADASGAGIDDTDADG